jgi:hypothetical protein
MYFLLLHTSQTRKQNAWIDGFSKKKREFHLQLDVVGEGCLFSFFFFSDSNSNSKKSLSSFQVYTFHTRAIFFCLGRTYQ